MGLDILLDNSSIDAAIETLHIIMFHPMNSETNTLNDPQMTPNPKFHSASVYDQLFLSYKILPNHCWLCDAATYFI